MRTLHHHDRPAVDHPQLELAMRRIVLFGAALVLALPAARGYNAWFGALPLWLLALPLASWWSLHHFQLPRWPRPVATRVRRRRSGAQARRRDSGLRRTFAQARAA